MEETIILFTILLGLVGLYYLYTQQQRSAEVKRLAKQKEQEALARQQLQPQKKTKSKQKKVDITAELKKKHAAVETLQEETDEHPSILHVLKGHKYAVTAVAYSPNGRFLATASTDRTIKVYLRDKLHDKTAKPHQINIEYDHATAMSFSSDGRILVVATEGGNIKLYQKLKVKPELVGEFPVAHKTDVHSVLMNDIGNWATIITCAGESDTDVKFWSLSGELLQVVNTNQVSNYHCVVSKDNRYVAIAAYTPEVKIFEITREKNGTFKKVNKIMTLHGHRTGVLDLAFNGSDTLPVNRIVTISKDASVRLWDINVRYAQQEDPKMLTNFTASEHKPFQVVDLSANGKLFAMARDKDIVFISASDSKEVQVIPNALEDSIKRILFSPDDAEVIVLGKHCKHTKIYKAPKL